MTRRDQDPVVDSHEHLSTWRFDSPYCQAILVGIVLFCCPGTYLSITGLGAGGKQPDLVYIVNDANVVLYCLFGASGVFGGSVINTIGPKLSLIIGATGYPVYAGSLWWLDQRQGTWFVVFAGAWLGLSAGLLWSCQGYITTCYPMESEKGKYIATSWVINAFGSVVGAAVVLGVTVSNTSTSGVPSTVYIVFICLECTGIAIAASLLRPAKVKRNDGRSIALFNPLPWQQELKGLARTLFDSKMGLLTLAIFSSEMYLSMTGSFNAYYFNARTRALANLCYWIFQILGALSVAFVCDSKLFGQRRRRAFAAIILVAVVVGGTFIAMIAFLASNTFDRSLGSKGVDWTDTSRFAGPFVIYIFFGACYPLYQNFHHWAYSTFSNEPHILGRYSGYFKGVQAWGTATAFGIDSHGVAFLHEAVAYFSLMTVGLCLSAYSIYKHTANTTYGFEEGVVVPEAFEDVILSQLPPIEGSSSAFPDKARDETHQPVTLAESTK